MSVCPAVSVFRFYGCCHPCFIWFPSTLFGDPMQNIHPWTIYFIGPSVCVCYASTDISILICEGFVIFRSLSDGNLVRAPSERFLLSNINQRKLLWLTSGINKLMFCTSPITSLVDYNYRLKRLNTQVNTYTNQTKFI